MSTQSPSLFIGMVTHARSRFNSEGAAVSLVESLELHARNLGIDVVSTVSDRDDYDPERFPVTRRALIHWSAHQAWLEYRWRRYLAAAGDYGVLGLGLDLAKWGGMTVKRSALSLAPRPWLTVGDLVGSRAAVRLINIDLSHLRLMDEAADSGCDWALILEDDAGASDPEEAMKKVAGAMSALAGSRAGFVSMSESIGLGELGVEGILTPAANVNDSALPGGTLWRASRPVTNTVCANLYRTEFLSLVREEIGRQGLLPVAPIDWRLNSALMVLFARGAVDADTCLWLRPGAFVQRSMHPGAAAT